MTLQEVINAVILKATGKPTILDPTNTKWEKIRCIANYYQSAWLNEPAVGNGRWNSLYERNRALGTISTKQEYDLDDDISEVSASNGDDIYILTNDGRKVKFSLVAYNDLQNFPNGNYVAKIGNQLVFNKPFAEDSDLIGGRLFVPCYHTIEDLEDADDETVVDNPYWLVTICAAEYIRNDIVKQNQYGNLIAEANNLMTNMIRANNASQVKTVRGNWRNPGGLI